MWLKYGRLDRDDEGVTAEMWPWHGGLGRRAYGKLRRRTGGPRHAPCRYDAVHGVRASREASKEPRGAAHGEERASVGVWSRVAWGSNAEASRRACAARGCSRRRGAAAPWSGHVAGPLFECVFSKNLYWSAASDEYESFRSSYPL
jgi:hypothetical protein